MKKKRMANIELMRILAMMMVVMLHFLAKGELLTDMGLSFSARDWVAWLLETLSIVAVNVYMLISGYFLVSSDFKCSRLLQLILQVLFYSLLVPCVFLATGTIKLSDLTIYHLLQYFLPVQMLQYWFITAYVLMYLFSPVLKAAAQTMKRGQLKGTIICLLLVLSVSKSILPFRLELDNLGYDCVWFMTVFLIAAYIRLHGIAFFKNKKISFTTYFVCCVLIFTLSFLSGYVNQHYGILESYILMPYSYNHILNIIASIAFFYGFSYLSIPEGLVSRIIIRISPYTLGVYLLHEQIEIRYEWPKILRAGAIDQPALFLVQCILCVLVVFSIGIVVDMVRCIVFHWGGMLLMKTPLGKLLEKIDSIMKG